MPAIRVEISAPELDRVVRDFRRASVAAPALLHHRLHDAAPEVKDAVVAAAQAYGLRKAAAATHLVGEDTVEVEDTLARYARFSGGIDRHPTFGHPPKVNQPIPPFWQTGIVRGTGKAVTEVAKVLDDIADIFRG